MIITFLTDFGIKDPYVAMMKGAVLKKNSKCVIVDITHEIPPQDIFKAGFFLMETLPYFPEKTLHLCVVDPGVGSSRRIILCQTMGCFILAPDNGVLSQAVQKYGIEKIYEVDINFFHGVSSTFHGRDVFAPAAGMISLSNCIEDLPFLHEMDENSLMVNNYPEPFCEGRVINGSFLYKDHFGNLIFNIRKSDLPEEYLVNGDICIDIGGIKLSGVKSHYHQSVKGDIIALWNSLGYLEIACVDGNAWEKISVINFKNKLSIELRF